MGALHVNELINIQEPEISLLPQVFFKNIKMRPDIKKYVITTDYFAVKVVIDNILIDVILDTGCVTFNLDCVFIVHGKSSVHHKYLVLPI
jgi:hypothetical protein